MNKHTFSVALLVVSLSLTHAHADGSPINSALYYEIGGGDVVNQSLNSASASRVLRVGASFKIPTMCELWDNKHLLDPDIYPTLVKSYAEGTLDDLSRAITNYLVTAPVTILIASLQRALPGLYDYSQNLKAQLDAEITYAKKSCQQVVDDLDAGNNPWQGWLKASTAAQWGETLNPASPTNPTQNILEAEEAVRTNHSNKSVVWFGGAKGGKTGTDADDPILLVKDVTSAGYAANYGLEYIGENIPAPADNISTNAIGDGVTSEAPPRLNKLWTNSNNASAFAIRVLGEQEISFCLEGCEGSLRPGMGLKPEYQREYDRLVTAWTTLLDNNTIAAPPSITDFETVSSNKVKITKPIFQYLLNLTDQERNLYIYRLISDVAVDRTIELALALRQILKAGQNTPQVKAYRVASTEVGMLVETLKTEIDDLAWEISTQDQLASKTASKLMAAQTLETIVGASTVVGTPAPRTRVNFENGRANDSP